MERKVWVQTAGLDLFCPAQRISAYLSPAVVFLASDDAYIVSAVTMSSWETAQR